MPDGLLIGLDVGGTKVLGVSVAAGGSGEAGSSAAAGASTTPLGRAQRPTVNDRDALIADLVAVAREVAGDETIHAVGIGLPGFIDVHGIAREAPHLDAVVGEDIGGAVARALGVQVVVENDANCAAWLAYSVDAPEASSVIAVTLGTGIGGGIIWNGALVRGAHGFAGEPGHMIVDPDGPLCSCGLSGCWEVWASGTGLRRLAVVAGSAGEVPELAMRAGAPELITGQDVMAGVIGEDPVLAAECQLILDRYTRWVAIGTVNLINLLDPDCVVFSGGIVEAGDTLIDGIRASVQAMPTMTSGRMPDLRISRVGALAGALGAALLAGEAAAVR